ncbi:MAG TPA: hypothetical protein VM097_07175 [Mycobacteriales bacterium]|nr:hypothetical protein [Mycobacteriales bacterium]
MTALRLPRRLVVGATSAALLGGVVGFVPLLGSAAAADAPPVAGCNTFVDPKGDADTSPVGGPTAYPDPDLDITGLVLGADDTSLRAVIRVDDLAVAPDTAAGDSWYVYFTYAGKAMSLGSTRFDPDQLGAVDDALFTADDTAGIGLFNPRTSLLLAGAYVPSDITVAYDQTANTVSFKVSRADIAKAAGVPFSDGTKLTAVYARNATSYPVAGGFYIDSTTATNDAVTTAKDVWTVGAGPCFGAAPAPTGTGTPTATPTATPTPTPTATPTPGGLYEQPRKGCAQYKDATGDADPTGIGEFNEGSLDITQVNLRSPSGAVQAYVGLVDPAEALFDLWSGRVYTVTMTVAGKAVALTAPGEGPATATVGGTGNTDIKATAKVDAKSKSLVFTVPLEGLAKAAGSAITSGTPITGTSVLTEAESELGPQEADTAAGTTPAEKTYAYGDNTCFLPPVGVLEVDADPSGQYGDRTAVYATLKDVDEAPVQGVVVTGQLGSGRAVSATTDDDGVAELLVPLMVKSGTYPLTITWAGNDVVGPTKATKSFKVVAEKTLLKVVALRGGAKGTVLDNDKHPVVGRPVVFTIGAKKRFVRTNSKGVAVLTGVAKGTAIKVSFPAVPGYYLGTPSYTVKAL